jgi:TetR/AcrR family transcriptional regulator, transcriptional repressor for nem operon
MSERRERLISAATELFLAGSFHNVGIAEICDVARVNKGTFYHFFPAKLDLLIEVIDRYVKDIAGKYREIALSDDRPGQKLRAVFMVPQHQNESWKAIHGIASGCFLGSIILELAATEPAVRDKARWAVNEWSQALQPVVAEFLKAENIKNLDAAAAADVIIGIVQGAHVLAKVKNDPTVFQAFGQMAIEMLKAAGNP